MGLLVIVVMQAAGMKNNFKNDNTIQTSSLLQCLHPSPVWTEWPGGLFDEIKTVLGLNLQKTANFPVCRGLCEKILLQILFSEMKMSFLIDSAQNCNFPINQHNAAWRTSKSNWDEFSRKCASVKQIMAPARTDWGNDRSELVLWCVLMILIHHKPSASTLLSCKRLPSRRVGASAVWWAGQMYHVRLQSNLDVSDQLFIGSSKCQLQWTREGKYGEIRQLFMRNSWYNETQVFDLVFLYVWPPCIGCCNSIQTYHLQCRRLPYNAAVVSWIGSIDSKCPILSLWKLYGRIDGKFHLCLVILGPSK